MLHDRGTHNECNQNGIAYGYRDYQARFRTIMAYDCRTGQCDGMPKNGCSRIPHFSSSISTYMLSGTAVPTGNAYADNAMQIDNVKAEVASYLAVRFTCNDDDDCGDDANDACLEGKCGVDGLCHKVNTCPTIQPTSFPTVAFQNCLKGQSRLDVKLVTDDWPAETSWTVKGDCGDGIAMSGGSYSLKGILYEQSACVTEGQYTFHIVDSQLDGICCGQGEGSYKVLYDGALVAEGGEFAHEKQHTFGVCPTASPSQAPSVSPSEQHRGVPPVPPSQAPSSAPSELHSAGPSISFGPSMSPSEQHSGSPSEPPSEQHSGSPVVATSQAPSSAPSELHSTGPSISFGPSMSPSKLHSGSPSMANTIKARGGVGTLSAPGPATSRPSQAPSGSPSKSPVPSRAPSNSPSASPQPSNVPSKSPQPSNSPMPSTTPSKSPQPSASPMPSTNPSQLPSDNPSMIPSGTPSLMPSDNPSSRPSNRPSSRPSVRLKSTRVPTVRTKSTKAPTVQVKSTKRPSVGIKSTRRPTTREVKSTRRPTRANARSQPAPPPPLPQQARWPWWWPPASPPPPPPTPAPLPAWRPWWWP